MAVKTGMTESKTGSKGAPGGGSLSIAKKSVSTLTSGGQRSANPSSLGNRARQVGAALVRADKAARPVGMAAARGIGRGLMAADKAARPAAKALARKGASALARKLGL
jgi:hypothetical protein